jgi:cell wall-associated NlpC family hydrolase
MYRKFITPVLALAALLFSASSLPVANAAESLPGIFHPSETDRLSAALNVRSSEITTSYHTPAALTSAKINTPSDVKIAFERPLVKSQPAPPKPVEPVAPVVSTETPTADTQAANMNAGPLDERGQETAGLAPWQVSQLNAQKNYMATMLTVPFSANPPAQAKGAEIVKIAKAHLGVPYVWGGVSPVDGWDCSGYVQWVFGQAGIKLPRVSQWVNETKIDPKDAQPGDLVVQDNGTHVGIYIGDGMMYSALNPSVKTLEHSTSIMKADYYRIS